MAGTFSIPLEQLARRYDIRMERVARKVVLAVGTEVILRTPVDKGMARGSWMYSKGSPSMEQPGTADKSGGVSILGLAAGVRQGNVATIHYLTNNLPYIERLENGYSNKAPHGMVAMAVLTFQAAVDAIVAEERRS